MILEALVVPHETVWYYLHVLVLIFASELLRNDLTEKMLY